jgi:uncharacterized repeat protein (TIGR01451 family)
LFADLAIDKTVSPSPAFTGSNFTYVVTVTNNGPSDATAVTVTDVPPAGIAFVTTPSQGTCTNIGGQIICDLGILTNTGIASITLVGTPASTGEITNIAVATALNVDQNPTNNVITNSVSVIAPAVLSVTPANHDFGSVATGTTVQTTFVVTNSGSATLNGTATLAIPQFTIASGSPFSIPALGTTNVVVDFTPDSAATFTDNVIFASNGGASTNQVTGTGTITTPPLLTVTPSDLDFGTLAVGNTSTLSFSVINDGIDTLSGTSTVSGAGFALVSGSTFDVSAGQTGTVSVTFSPGAAAAFTGSVVFTSNGGVSTNGLTGAATNAFPGPVAVFTASANNGAPPLIVNFTDHSTPAIAITSRLWSFGDGDISTSTNPTHVYTNAGSFTVSLTVHSPGGSNTVSHLVVVTGVAKNSPVGDWQVTVSGADKGIAYLTLSNNATASGYEIRMKTFGLDVISGTWGLDAKGKLTGAFGEKLGSATNWTGTLAGTAKTGKSLSGKVTAIPAGFFNWKGIPATTFPDLSGTWSGQVAIAKTANINVAYKITMNATNSGVFDVAATTATNTVLGQFIVTSKDAIAAWLQISTNREATLSGKAKLTGSKGPSISLKGTDASADKINLNLIKE